MLIGERQTFSSDKKMPLPYDAEVEYLQGVKGSYIDTGVVPQFPDKLKYETEIQFLNTYQRQIIGRQGFFYFGVINNKFQPGLVSGNTVNITMTANAFYEISMEFVVDASKRGIINYSVNGNSGIVKDKEFQDTPKGGSIWLFGINNDPNVGSADNREKYFKIYRNDVLIRDFIPVRKGNVGYMYDRANPSGGLLGNGLYGNSGTGNFGVGPDKHIG